MRRYKLTQMHKCTDTYLVDVPLQPLTCVYVTSHMYLSLLSYLYLSILAYRPILPRMHTSVLAYVSLPPLVPTSPSMHL